ncbi:hypothetical protein GCM10010994_20380 [Chelatococcus reniformis]|uniref:Uncharacterized protein n=1 Tax=Chelatococcus reniformis TaxID=1494448 RepID=A0A916U782_9HYPH|nr:hypothetical protein GCM10010994_20380 [Chelatococcus reniformis]
MGLTEPVGMSSLASGMIGNDRAQPPVMPASSTQTSTAATGFAPSRAAQDNLYLCRLATSCTRVASISIRRQGHLLWIG